MTKRLTPERLADVREMVASAPCDYVGRCNSGRCPAHGGQAQAMRDLLAELDAVTAERDAAIARAEAAKRALGNAHETFAACHRRAEAAEAALHRHTHQGCVLRRESCSEPEEER